MLLAGDFDAVGRQIMGGHRDARHSRALSEERSARLARRYAHVWEEHGVVTELTSVWSVRRVLTSPIVDYADSREGGGREVRQG